MAHFLCLIFKLNKIIFMKIHLILISFCFALLSCKAQVKETKFNVEKTETEWKESLTAEQFYILRQAGTERPFTGEYNKHYEDGTYLCAACDNPLYESEHKFDSGTGWPSFDRAVENSIAIGVDYKIGYARNELKCGNCGGHLGHVFGDGPATTGQRHCINSAALKFTEK